MAYYILLPDGRNVEFPDNFPRDQAQAIAARMAGETQAQQPTETAPAQPQRGSNLGLFGDVVGSAITGGGGIASAGGGLYGLVTGDYDTGATRLGRRIQQYGETFMSPQLLEARERLDREMREAEGQGAFTEAGVAARGILTDPRLATSFVAEQLPQFIGSLGVGRIAGGIGQLAARRGGAEAAQAAGRTAAVGAAIGTGTGLQTGEVANSTYEDIINLPAELIERSPNYQTLRQTMTDEEARHQLGVEGSRVAAAIAAPISAGTAALFGAERFALGNQIKQRAIARVVLGATGEAAQEGFEEGGGRFAQNIGALRGDIERDLSTGVGGAAARGAILGGIIGGGTGLISGRAPDLTTRGEDTDLSRALDPYLASIERTPAAVTQPGVADRVRLVTENLPFTAEQFLRATARDQEILVNRAQREVERRQSGQNLSVLDPQGNRDRETANIRAPQSASRPSDELIYGQAGSRADAFQFERGRGERMEGGMTQAEFLRQRAEEMARAQAGTGGVSGQVQAEGARQLPANVLKRSDRNLTRMLATASPQDAQLIVRELERRRSAAGAPVTGAAAAEATLTAAGQTYRPSLGTGAEQTATAARATRATEQPVGTFFPLVENFIEGHVRNYGSSQPLSVPAFQQYLSERTGDTVPLNRAQEIFDTYYNASSKRAVPKGQGWILQRSTVKQAETKGEPSGRGRGRMPPKVAFGPGAQSQRIYRAVAPKGVRTDADGRPLPPAAPPAAPLRASPSGFTDPRQRELSAREVGAQPAEAAQTESAQDAETTQRATKIVNDRLDKIEKRGGKKARAAVEKVIRDGKYNAEQVYAAFMAADRISSLLPVGANHEIEFVERLLVEDAEAAKASGALKVTEAQGERVRPTGDFNKARFNQLMREGATADQAFSIVQREAVNGIIRLSLAPNQLAVIGETASHEAFHVLQDYYAKYDPNFSKLMGQSFKDGMVIGDVDPTIRRKLEQAKFPGSDQSYWQVLSSTLPGKLSAREAQAYVFGSLADASKRGVPMSGLKPAFARFVNFLRQFFTRMGNTLRGNGFQTAESMLGRVARGDARRFAGRATPTDVDFPKEAKKEVENGVAASPTEYSARDFKPMEPPVKTVTAYKLFRANSRRPDEIFPLFVDADMSVPMGEWIEATDAYHFTADNGLPYTPARTGSRIKIPNDDIRRELFERGRISRPDAEFVTAVAYRPGWHASDLPYTTHLTEKNRVWAEVEMAADVDWQERANANAQRLKNGEMDPSTAQITDQVPLGGFYRYKTNPNMTGEWMISGGMRVNRVLSDQEVRDINRNAEPAREYSARQINTPEFKRWFGDSKVVDFAGDPLVVYHGTSRDRDFTSFKVGQRGAWFTDDPFSASEYAENNDSGYRVADYDPREGYIIKDTSARVFPVYLSIQNPATITEEQAKRLRQTENYAKVQREVFDEIRAKGHDGVKIGDDVWVVLGGPAQIKSAIGNRGTFDPTKSRIDYSARETIKSKPGVNARRLAQMFGPQLYGDMKNMGAVNIKEVLQNSYDAIKTAMANGQIDQGRIRIDAGDGHKISMTDNGVGMSPNLLGGKFLQIAGTGKSEEGRASGGFGVAKMLFLYGNKELRVVTMRDGKVAELNTTGPALFDALEDPDLAPEIEVRDPTENDRYMFPEGHGTHIEMTMPTEYEDPSTGKTQSVRGVYSAYSVPALENSPLFENIEVTFDGRTVPNIGSEFKLQDYTQFANVKFPWGTARIYISKEPNEQQYGDNLHVLSNGLWQFSEKLTKEPGSPYSGPIPYTFYVDISPSVRPDQPGYPFSFNRQSFTREANEEYRKVISHINALYAVQNLANEAGSFGVVQYVDPLTGRLSPPEDLRPDMPVINTAFTGIRAGDNVTVKDGKLLVDGKELPELTTDELKYGIPKAEDLKIDPAKINTDLVMVHDNVLVNGVPFSNEMRALHGELYDAYNAYIGDKFLALRNEVARIMDYPQLLNEAIGVSIDKEYRGVSIKVPFSGQFVNPMVPESNDPFEAGFGIVGTMVHELAHHKVRSHNASFPAEMQKIQYKLLADKEFDFISFQREVANTVRDAYADVLADAQRIFEDENITARGNRFADSQYERRPESRAEGVPERDRREGAGAGAGERLLGVPVRGDQDVGGRGPAGELGRGTARERPVEFSARDLSGLGTRVRNATPSDIRSKQFDVEYTRVSNLIDRGLRKVPFVGKRVKETTAEDLIILMQDRMLPMGRMVDFVRKNGGNVADASDIYMTEELYHGRVGAGVDDRAARLYKPVFDEMRRLNISMKDMDEYLEARHAVERNAFVRSINEDPSKGAGITDEQAAAIMKRLEPQKAKLEKVAPLVDAIVADTNKTRAESGLTPDYSKLNSRTNFKHYVPLRGFAEEDIFDDRGVESLRARTGQGFKMRGQEDRSITGRRSRATNILANVILQNEETVIRSEKNKVGQALLKLIRDNPQQTAGFAKILEKAPVEPRIVNGKVKLMSSGLYKNRDDVMVVKEGGNEIAVEIYDERLAKALTGASGLGAENSSMVLRGLAGLNRFLAMVNTTLNPEFVISNFARDLQTANINIKQFDTKGLGRKIISDVPMALAGARAAIRGGDMSGKWAQAYEDFRRAGGTTEFLGLRDIDGKLEKINEEIMGNKGSLVKRPFKAMLKLFEDYNSVAENAIRLSTFQTLRDMGVSDAKAAQVAKNLTVNFNKAGQNRVLMNSLYLFYNASIQGSMAMINAIARSKRVRKYVAGIITAGFMHDVINAMMSGMDEDERKIYDKIPDDVLERNYVLMDPFGLSERGYYALPMPYGFNAFFNMGRNLSRVSRGEGEPMKTAGSIVMGFVDAFNPIGGTQSFFNFVAPTILDPFVDLYSNRNFADRPIVPERSGFGPQSPDSQRFWSNTFPPYVTVAQWLNQITGGTSVIPGQVDISPNTIGYLMNYAFGAAGAFVERVGKFGFSTVPDMLTGDLEEVEIRDIPFVRKLYGNVTTRNDLESFMENTNRIAQIQKEFNEAERFGEGERMERAMRDYPRELAVAPLIQGLVRERQKITREMNEIRRDPNIDAESRRELLRVLKQEADMYVGQVNMLYNTQVRR